jgi:hypothetical protein
MARTLPSQPSCPEFDQRHQHRCGILSEQLTINFLVETLSINVPAIQRVSILVAGKPRETLAAHADLTDSFDVPSIQQTSKQ